MSMKRIFGSYTMAILLLIVLSLALLAIGDIHLSLLTTIKTLFGDSSDRIANIVIWDMRMPYIVAALTTGSCLAISGLILQSLTNNPLVDSSILGVNAGASLGAVVLIGLAGIIKAINVDTYLPVAAVFGALISLLIVGIMNREGSKMQILLGGVALTALLNGIILMVELSLNKFDFDKVLVWLSGSFWNLDPGFLTGYAIAAVILIAITSGFSRELGVLMLGDLTALSLGVNVKFVKRMLMLMAIGMAAVAVSVGGAISLVGLMAPNIARKMCGSKIQVLLPVTCLIGCVIMLLSTLVANNLFLPSVLPVGLVVAVITMPYFLYQLFRY